MDETHRLRISTTGLYCNLGPRPGEPAARHELRQRVRGTVVVVVGSNGNPRGKRSIRWVAPKQESQPFMFRRTLPEAMALAERVLRLKGVIE